MFLIGISGCAALAEILHCSVVSRAVMHEDQITDFQSQKSWLLILILVNSPLELPLALNQVNYMMGTNAGH